MSDLARTRRLSRLSRRSRPGGRRRAPSRVAVLAAALVVAVLLGALPGPVAASALVETARRPGPAPIRIVEAGQDHASGVQGPAAVSAALAAPATPGDLLVAGVICGVWQGGMTVPRLTFPSGWHQVVAGVGGIEDGLEAAIAVRPDVPGGTERFAVARVPAGSDDYCTTFWVEVAAGPRSVGIEATASGAGDAVQAVGARTRSTGAHSGGIVLLLTTDGTEIPHTSYRIPTGFELLGQQQDGQVDQPGTFSDRASSGAGRQGGTVSWPGPTTDACAVVAVLRI